MTVIDSHILSLRLSELCAQLSFQVTENQQKQLVAFVTLLAKWNKAYNLTSVRNPVDMVATHIIDSIVVKQYITGSNIIDVGTGPGLPGIPLAILDHGSDKAATYTLVDSLGKRVRFMTQTKHDLGLLNIVPIQSRIQDVQPDKPFDGVLSRAFASLKDMLHWCEHLVDSNGRFFALKGQFPEEELHSLPTGFVVENYKRLDVPGVQAERHLITIRKSED